jgi:hypothetical protein
MIAIDAASIGPCVRTIVSAAVRSAPTGRRGGDSGAAGGGAAGGRTRASASRPTRPRSRRTAASASLIVGKAVAPVLALDVRTAQRTANSIRRRIQRCHVLNGGTRPIVTSAAFHARLETPRRRGLDRRNRRLKRRCARPEPAQLHWQPGSAAIVGKLSSRAPLAFSLPGNASGSSPCEHGPEAGLEEFQDSRDEEDLCWPNCGLDAGAMRLAGFVGLRPRLGRLWLSARTPAGPKRCCRRSAGACAAIRCEPYGPRKA